MSVAREERDISGDVAAVEGMPHAQSRVAGRWFALIVAVTVLTVLVTGWLVDVVGSVGSAQATGAMTQGMTQDMAQQVGLSTVALSVSAPSSSGQALVLHVMDASGVAVEGVRVQCALSMPGMAMAIPAISAVATGQPGWYRCVAPTLSPGRWSLALTIMMPSGEIDHATFSFDVA